MSEWQQEMAETQAQEAANQANSGGTATQAVNQNDPSVVSTAQAQIAVQQAQQIAQQASNPQQQAAAQQALAAAQAALQQSKNITDMQTFKTAQDALTEAQEKINAANPIVSTNAEYTGQASALGGTWGKTPATLAQEAFAGGQIKYTVTNADGTSREATEAESREILQQAISGMSDQQQAQYKTALAQLEEAPGSTPEEKLAYVQQQNSAEALALPISQRNIQDQSVIGQQEQATIKQQPQISAAVAAALAQNNLVTLSSGEYVDRETYDKLPAEYRKILDQQGIEGLNSYLDKQESMAKASQQDAIKSVQADLDRLNAKQSAFDSQSLWDKVMITLNTPVTFDEAVQAAAFEKTAAFSSDQIQKDYDNAKLDALEAGSDLAITPEQYKEQVLSMQMTAQQLGMSLVPFSYALPGGGWDQMQLWQKIVYPALDIISLVPVVGWVGEGVEAAAKGLSVGARIAALGGRDAVEFAAKDAAVAVEKATTQKIIQEALLSELKSSVENATDDVTRNILKDAIKPATQDVELATKEYDQIVKNAGELAKMNDAAAELKDTGSGVYEASTRVQEATGKAASFTEPAGTIAGTGAIGYSTVSNWNDLTPEQRAAGLAMAALSSGILGKAANLAENIIDPFKIPIAVLKGRSVSSKAEAGEIFSSEKTAGIKGTERLVLDYTIRPEDARTTVADLMKQLTEGKGEAKSTLKTANGEKELKVKGTGLQSTVGETSISATPMGEIFKGGTGATGAKTNLEKYLEDANNKFGTKVEIESKPIKIGDTEVMAKTISTPGLTAQGKEGGMYVGSSLYNQFSHKAAFGADGKISAGVLIGTPGISELPEGLRTVKDIATMENKAMEEFDGAKNINQEVEGFKQYANYMEFENVITNGSQLERVQNLRSTLADKLHLNQGEYYTRDPKGKIQLFQMYLEGGRATPYTMKELYALKGNALKNSLEDLFFGLEKKIDDLKEGKLFSPKEDVITKEEQVSKAFADIDDTIARKGMTPEEASRLKKEVISQYRERTNYPESNRAVIQKEIAQIASRSPEQRAKDEQDIKDFGRRIQTERDQQLANYINGMPIRAESTTARSETVPTRIDTATRNSMITSAREATKPEPVNREPERQQIISRTPVRESSRVAINDRPVTREGTTGRQEPRASGLKAVRQQGRGAVQETPRQIGRETPRETTRGTVRETPRTAPRETPRENPRAEERGTVREAPRGTPRETVRETSRGTPREPVRQPEPRAGPRETIRTLPKGTPAVPRETVAFIVKHSEHKGLTEKQLEGALAWKQGLFYQVRWQPFGAKDVFYSREPVPGVKYFDGIGSAAKSAVTLYGEVPQNVRLDMGIVDVNISRNTSDTHKPILGFKADAKQKTHNANAPAREGIKQGR